MKSEERHELKTNELSKLADSIRPWVDQYGTKVLIGAIALGIIGGIVYFWRASAEEAAAKSWSAVANSRSTEQFGEAADANKGTVPGLWAKLREADGLYQTGLQQVFSDKKAAISDLKKAQENYTTILDSDPPSDIRARALYGLASTQESLSEGKPEEAIKTYETLLKEFSGSVYEPLVKERIKKLNNSGTQEFYAWFATQSPKPKDTATPQDNIDILPPPTQAPEIPMLLRTDGTEPEEAPKASSESGPSLTDPNKTKTEPKESGPAIPTPNPTEKPETKPEEQKPATKPETKPQEKPADKPETNPADKPTEKPGTKPADKPETSPADKPNTEKSEEQDKPVKADSTKSK